MNRNLLNLLIKNKGKKGRLEVKQQADQTTILVYGILVSTDADAEWWGGVSAESFVRELLNISAPNIVLRVNSPGGDVFAGRAIQAAMTEHPANITVKIDGQCASAATYMPMAADKVEIADGAFLMIHQSATICYGNADDFLHTAGVLQQIDQSLVETYQKKTGQSTEQLTDWLKNETWFSAADCVKYGFADSILGEPAGQPAPEEEEEELENRLAWDLSAYRNAPKQLQPQAKPGPLPMTMENLQDLIDQRIANAQPKPPTPAPVNRDALKRRMELAAKTA